MKLTLPQIFMYNHAAWVNRENSERRYKAKKALEGNQLDPAMQAEEERVMGLQGDDLTHYLTHL